MYSDEGFQSNDSLIVSDIEVGKIFQVQTCGRIDVLSRYIVCLEDAPRTHGQNVENSNKFDTADQ